jgi:hypothetical protein
VEPAPTIWLGLLIVFATSSLLLLGLELQAKANAINSTSTIGNHFPFFTNTPEVTNAGLSDPTLFKFVFS